MEPKTKIHLIPYLMKRINYIFVTTLFLLVCSGFAQTPIKENKDNFYCNPINISYRFFLDGPSRREAADPAIVMYRDNYFLFASKLGGYYYSPDLLQWNFVGDTNLPIENYAPTAVVFNDEMYWLANGTDKLYKTSNPISGKWEVANPDFPVVGDPAFFVDTDGKIYLYHGVSNNDFIKGVELDIKNNLSPKGENVNLFKGNPKEHGWERPGDYNELNTAPWIEAPWMNKVNGTYYLQYSAPGTEYKSYADGYYTSKSPLGPFT